MNKKLALWRKWPQHLENITDWQKFYVLSIPVTNFLFKPLRGKMSLQLEEAI